MATQADIEALYPHKPLAGQTAIITGANSGIGEGVARHLAVAGANVAVNYVVHPETAQTIVDEINAGGGSAIGVQADVGDEAAVQAMFKTVIDKFGTVDILVANAGLQRDAAFGAMTLQQWEFVLKVNLTGQFLCAREAVREFKRRGMRDVSTALGKIIHMSSVHETIPWGGHVNYASSKGGILQLMKSLAQEVAPEKIRVNSIGPGAIETPINTGAWNTPEALAKLLTLIPYGRAGVTDDIGKVAVFLASDQSDYITGQTLFVDGGMTLYPGFATGG
ncbi:SDR family oxidoreductase [soil metagenome]